MQKVVLFPMGVLPYPIVVFTQAGLEDLLITELSAFGCAPNAQGHGFVVLPPAEPVVLLRLNRCLRFAESVELLLASSSLADGTMAEIERVASGAEFAELLKGERVVAVEGLRRGKHPFTSVDLKRGVAAVLAEKYERQTNRPFRADLKNPDVSFIARLRDKHFMLTVNTSGKRLSHRLDLPFEHYAPMNMVMASALLHFSDFRESKSLLDPMCGGGNILFEAAMQSQGLWPSHYRTHFAFERHPYFSKQLLMEAHEIPRPESFNCRLAGGEFYGGKFHGFKKNVGHLGYPIETHSGSAVTLGYVGKKEFPSIVVNPPFGVKLSEAGEIRGLYTGFARACAEKGARTIVAVTPRWQTWCEGFEAAGYGLNLKKPVVYGEMPVFLLKTSMP